jgi:hypothetical protein
VGKKSFVAERKLREVELKKSNFSRGSFEEQLEVSALTIKEYELKRTD